MPREGTVQSLVKVGDTVAKGAPVGTFSSSALDVLKNVLKPEEMAPDNLQRLFDKSFQGTLTSPCDCRVVAQLVGEQLDMIVGSRVEQHQAAYRRGHRFGNRAMTGILARLFGRSFTDIFSGYRVFSRRFVKSFPALISLYW